MNTRVVFVVGLCTALLAVRAPGQIQSVNARMARSAQAALVSVVSSRSGVTRPELSTNPPIRSDIRIARDVSRRVLAELGPALSGSVVSCSDGVVVLRGHIENGAHRQVVTEVASRVAGVTAVHNLMAAPGESAPAAPAPPPRDTSPAIAGPFGFVTGTLLGGRNILVEVDGGTVTITGEVSSAVARRHVAAVIRALPGVRRLDNRTEVRRPSSRQDDKRLGMIIFRSFQQTFDLQPVAPAMSATVKNGVARLKGRVRTEEQRLLAGAVAAGVRTIVAVDNRLVVDPTLRLHPRAFAPTRSGPGTTVVMTRASSRTSDGN